MAQADDFKDLPDLKSSWDDDRDVLGKPLTGIMRVYARTTGTSGVVHYEAEISSGGRNYCGKVKTSMLQKLVPWPLREYTYTFPCTAVIEAVRRPNGPGASYDRHVVSITEHVVSYDLTQIVRRCGRDFQRRFKAVRPSIIRTIKDVLKKNPNVKDADRNRDVVSLLDGMVSKDVREQLATMHFDRENEVLFAFSSMEKPVVIWQGPDKPFTVYCSDRLAIQYSWYVSPLSSRFPTPRNILSPRRFVRAAYDFEPDGKLRGVRVWCPKDPSATKLPIHDSLSPTGAFHVGRNPESKDKGAL